MSTYEVAWRLKLLTDGQTWPKLPEQRGPLQLFDVEHRGTSVAIRFKIPTIYVSPTLGYVTIVRRSQETFLADIHYNKGRNDLSGVPSANRDRLCEANLQRWKGSGKALEWVLGKNGVWAHDDWESLLAQLRQSRFWPLNETAVGSHLEEIRAFASPLAGRHHE
jgi:hypothetical protein